MRALNLCVDWLPFMNGLRAASRALRPKAADEGVLSFDGSHLHVDLPGGGFSTPARGYWPDAVRVPARYLCMFVKIPPRGEPIEFRMEDNRFCVENSSVRCTVQEGWRSVMQIPVNTTPAMLVAMGLRYTEAEIESSGLLPKLHEARAQMERRTRSAAKALAPYGVTAEQIREWLEAHISESPDLNRI